MSSRVADQAIVLSLALTRQPRRAAGDAEQGTALTQRVFDAGASRHFFGQREVRALERLDDRAEREHRASCMVLISQNRSGQKERIRSEVEYEANIRAGLEVTQLHVKIDAMIERGKDDGVLREARSPGVIVRFRRRARGQRAGRARRHVGFQVTVTDECAQWLNAERFPKAARRLEQPDVVARSLGDDEHTYCCVTTHGHPLDQACIEAPVKRKLGYLGVIGSQRKALRFMRRMEAGASARPEVAGFESPMGVELDALTPSLD